MSARRRTAGVPCATLADGAAAVLLVGPAVGPHSPGRGATRACALGHPIGATGARLIVTLLHAMEKSNVKRGIASLCIGGGEATAIAVERKLN